MKKAKVANSLENIGLFFCFLNICDKNTVFEYGRRRQCWKLVVCQDDFLSCSDSPLQFPICIQSSGKDFGEPLCLFFCCR